MADYLPQNSGLWSTTTWITAFSNLTAFAGNNTPPTFIDDVYADGKTITIDIDTRVRTLLTSTTPRTGGLTGGGFRINNAVSLSANLSAGTTTCLTFLSAAPNSCTIYGNITGSNTNGAVYGILNNSSGTVIIYGDSVGGQGTVGASGTFNNGIIYLFGSARAGRQNQSDGIRHNSGTVYVVGSAFGGNTNTNPTGIYIVSGSVYLTGGLLGGSSNNCNGIWNTGSGIVSVVGGPVVGGVGGLGINNASTGTVFIQGNVIGGTGIPGITNGSTGSIFVTGNIIGGPGGSAHGMQNGTGSTGNIVVNGNAIGGTGAGAVGIVNNIGGTVVVNGNAIAGTGSLSYGIAQNGTGYMEVNGLAIGNDFGLGSVGINSAPGIFGSQTGTTIIRGLSCGARGQWPTAGNVFIIPQSSSTATFETSAFQDVTLFTALSTNIVPPVSSVRQGTIYNLGDYTGTCRIPSISSVLQGVSVDNTVGIAALRPQTIWNYSVLSATDVNSLGGRLKEVATVQSVGQQLTALS